MPNTLFSARRLGGSLACLMALVIGATGAAAQTPPSPSSSSPPSSVVPPPDASGPQTAVPTRRTGPADVPGGSARNGIVRPPPVGGVTPVIKPPVQSNMPVITPPGTGAVQPGVVPK